MRRLLHVWMLVMVLALGWNAEARAESQQPRDRLVAVEPVHHRQQGAMLSDGQTIYRICNSRPQRVVFSFTPPLSHGGSAHHDMQHLGCDALGTALYHDCVATGYQFDASSRHYIFALRHIIR